MLHRRVMLTLSVTSTVVLVTLLLSSLPGIWTPFGSVCTASAQDTPCLAQEATISAIQVELQQVAFQSTLDAMSIQSTLQAATSLNPNAEALYLPTIQFLESELATARASASVSPTQSPGSGTSFAEQFDTNDRGWDLTPRDTGTARISQGQLLVSAKPGNYYGVQIPGVSTEQLWVQSDMTNRYNSGVPCFNDQFIGFMLGDPQSDGHYLFVVGFDELQDGCGVAGRPMSNGLTRSDMVFWSVRLYGGNRTDVTLISQTDYDTPIWESGQVVSLALEARNGTFSMYLNGSQAETIQISPNDDQIALVAYAPDTGRITNYYAFRADEANYEKGAAASFDNVIYRLSR